MKKFILSLFVFLLAFASMHAQVITTVAGNGSGLYNGDNISALDAGFVPTSVIVDNSGNMYIGDYENNRVRKIDITGSITTIAGTGVAGFSGDDSLAINAKLNHPSGLARDQNGNIYVCDAFNNRVRKIDTAGIITTVAGNGTGGFNGDNILATAAELWEPFAITLGIDGEIYIVDCGNHRIRKISMSGMITTFAGTGVPGFSGDNGPATAASLKYPRSLIFDNNHNMYIADAVNHRVRKVDSTGVITTCVGNGTPGYSGDNGIATAATMTAPYALAIDGAGNLYIADGTTVSNIRKVTTSGIITTYAGISTYGYSGDNGPATAAALDEPSGLAFDTFDNMYIADFQNARIRYIKSTTAVSQLNNKTGNISLFPNPNTGKFILDIVSDGDELFVIAIYNGMGEKVSEFNAIGNTTTKVNIDQPDGTYYLVARSDNKLLAKIITLMK